MIILGIDWARSKHDALLMDPTGRVVQRLTIPHDARGLQRLADAVAVHEPDPSRVRVAVEMHDGGLLAWLLDRGYAVVGINPKSAQRARDRYRPAGGKDDASDAFILADMLRTDRGSLRTIRPDDDATLELRSLVELRDARVQERTALFQRLRARLDEWCPDLSCLCNDFNRIWQRRLLEQFPLQQDLHQAHGRTLNAFIRRHRLRPETAERIRHTRHAQPMPIPQPRLISLRLDIQQILRQIESLTEAITEIEKRIEQQLDEHPDIEIFRSLPIKGNNILAAILAGLGQDRDLTPGHHQLAAAWGVAPLTVQSGKQRRVQRRHAADRTPGQALIQFAFNTSSKTGCWARDFYQRKRAEGKAHHTALRCLAQRWLKILHRMWKDRVPYDEQHHRNNLRRHATTPIQTGLG